MTFVIGNIIALVGSILMIYVGTIKDKKRILYVQSLQIGLFAISNLVLNGISGFIINTINFIRNIICYKELLSLKVKIFLSIISIASIDALQSFISSGRLSINSSSLSDMDCNSADIELTVALSLSIL